ncbi:MAG: hypothetical protein RSA92_06585, partial [Bacteroidaceae bacterium]
KMQQNIIAATEHIDEMNNAKYFFQSPLFFMIIVVFLVWIIIIRPIMKNNKKRDEETTKSGGVVSDDEHGWIWKTCRWNTILFTFLSIAIITGGIHSDYFIEAFCSSLMALLAQLVASLLLPSTIRIISNKQHGVLASSLVAVISLALMCIAIIALKIHQQGFLVEMAKIMCVCTSYKIMRSVAGFPSVFWRGKR